MTDTLRPGVPVVPAHRFETHDPDQLAELLAPFSSDADLRVRGTSSRFRVHGVAFLTQQIETYRLGVSCVSFFRFYVTAGAGSCEKMLGTASRGQMVS